MGEFDADLGNLFRRESGRITSALTRLFGVHNLPLVEDVVGDALTKAVEVWKISGVPDNPAAWITAAAKNRAIDVLRRERNARTAEPELAAALSTEWTLVGTVDEAFGDEVVRDEQLRMMFACCQRTLAPEVSVALVLNLLCGFGAREIAHAFLVPLTTMEKRVARGKAALAEAGRLPEVTAERAREHLASVHSALYLLFNEGYHGAHASGAVRAELCAEAIHLTSMLTERAATATPATWALLALMCLTAARLPARRREGGALLALGEQDRAKWDRALIERGRAALVRAALDPDRARYEDGLSTYHFEAEIAQLHAEAPSREGTRWGDIVAIYEALLRFAPSPVVALNRAIARGEADGLEHALADLRALERDERLAAYPFLPAALGDVLARLGRQGEARAAFSRAADLARSEEERAFFVARSSACEA